MSHLLLFVHGMGSSEAGWSVEAVNVLRDAWSQYENLSGGMSFDNAVTTAEVVYDSEFADLRDRWNTDLDRFAVKLQARLEASDEDEVNGLQNRVNDIARWTGAGRDNFFRTHAMDVVLYRFFNTVRHNVNAQVANQIIRAVTSTSTGYRRWLIVAHSLGTAVVHNTLEAMYGTTYSEDRRLRVMETRPRMIAMISNVGRVLELPGYPAYNSRVRPGSALDEWCCDIYLNVRHRLDPFTHPKPFDPADWTADSGYQHIQPEHFRVDTIREIHQLEHYLINPLVHVPLIRGIVGERMIGEQEFARQQSTFDAESGKSWSNVLRDQLEPKLAQLSDDWMGIIDALEFARE